MDPVTLDQGPKRAREFSICKANHSRAIIDAGCMTDLTRLTRPIRLTFLMLLAG
ncbi:MAG: hypothetical protein ACI9U2_003251, partial [Bradymonadia bacterium]